MYISIRIFLHGMILRSSFTLTRLEFCTFTFKLGHNALINRTHILTNRHEYIFLHIYNLHIYTSVFLIVWIGSNTYNQYHFLKTSSEKDIKYSTRF